jgi:heme/copper-type cytochrome/quinol oxidase subunit 2
MKTNWKRVAILVITMLAIITAIIGLQSPKTSHTNTVEVITVDPVADTPVEVVEVKKEYEPKTVTVDMVVHKRGFSPENITVTRGDTVQISIKGTDGRDHGFVLPAYGIDKDIPFGELQQIEFVADTVGEFEFFTDVPSHIGFGNVRGTVIIQEQP